MFLPFVKKNATELDVITKLQKKYKDLPFSSILGLIVLYEQKGLEELNKTIEKYINEAISVDKGVLTYLTENLSGNVDLQIDDIPLLYLDLIPIRKDLPEIRLDHIYNFIFIINKNDSGIFKTNVSDLVDTDKNPLVSVITTIVNRKEIFEDLSTYINLDSNVFAEEISFDSEVQLKKEIIKTIIEDPEKIKTYKFIYFEPEITVDNPNPEVNPEPFTFKDDDSAQDAARYTTTKNNTTGWTDTATDGTSTTYNGPTYDGPPAGIPSKKKQYKDNKFPHKPFPEGK